jgi:hypothetical protein
MLKWIAGRYTKKRDDEVWGPYELWGQRPAQRLNWLHAAVFSDWQAKSAPIRGYLLLSTSALNFSQGLSHVEIPLGAVRALEWSEDLGSLMLLYRDSDGEEAGAAFDVGVAGQGGASGRLLKEQFSSQLAEHTRQAWNAQSDAESS